MTRRYAVAAAGLACVAAISLGAYAGKTDAPPAPPSPPAPVSSSLDSGSAWVGGCGSDADCAEMERWLNDRGLHLTGGGAVTVDQPTEDEPGWNCLTMGNLTCGPTYVPVVTAVLGDGSLLTDALVEGERQDWSGCLIEFGDTSTIVCPDGYVEAT